VNTPIHSLDARYYTDPEIFKLELDGVLSRTWQFAGHASQLVSIKAYYNVCQHRAHQLVSDSGNAPFIVCPYHAWTYELTGQLRGAPNSKVVPGFDKKNVCLSEVRLENFNGFLFANLDYNAKPMEEWFPEARQQLAQFVPQINDLKPIQWVEVAERCNWKVSVENYSECYHCQLNHPTFANGVVKSSTYDIQPQGYCLRHTTECQNLESMTYPIDLSANDYAGKYSSWFLWPMMSFQVYPGNVLNTYHWRAIDHENVMLWRGWYATDSTDKQVIYDLAKQDRETTVEEDIGLVESVQRGLGSRGYKPGPLIVDPSSGVKSEHSIKVLQQWMREAIDS